MSLVVTTNVGELLYYHIVLLLFCYSTVV